MKILVTGGTGFTGAALVRRLLQDGHAVIALDYKEGIDTDALRKAGADVRIGSVTDPGVVDACSKGVELVHHLAAAFRELNVPPSHYDRVNVEGTRNVFEAAVRNGVRKVVYCSTCGVHGNVEHPPADEDAPIAPADYYQRTKYLGEVVAQEYVDRLEVAILRPAAIYGPGDPERFYMIFRKVRKGWFPMFGSGRTYYHPLYIDNLVDAFVLCHPPGAGHGRTYLIADQRYYPIQEIVQKVGEAMEIPVRIRHFPVWPVVAAGHVFEKTFKPLGLTPPIFPRRVDWYRQNRAFTVSRAQRELGYRPAVELDEGLRQTAAWYRQRGLL